jgi:hypothetical protein
MKKLLFIVLVGLAMVSSGLAQSGAILDTRDEYWIYMEGPEADEETGKDYPNVLEGATEYEDSCWFNGTVYREGELKDIGEKMQNSSGSAITFEAGGWHPDREICLNIPGRGDDVSGATRESDNYRGGDKGGEWWDQDQWIATRYLRNNAGDVYSDAWQEIWVEQPDSASDPSETGIIPGEGIAMEDDCAPEYMCEDIRDETGRQGPYSARFVEGALDDDNALDVETPFSIRTLGMFDNRVQAGNETGHEDGETPGNTQDNETFIADLDERPMQNSRIDPEDDEWALTPRLAWSVANDGTPYKPGSCYGAPREQGVDKDKTQAVYANSFANASEVYTEENSSPDNFEPYVGPSQDADTYSIDGNWINPDNDVRSVTQGNFTCDLTGKDWGYGYRYGPKADGEADDGEDGDDGGEVCESNNPPSASFLVSKSGLAVSVESTSEDPDANIVLYEWDWTSDGNIEGTGETSSNTYSSDGTYTITHNVTDDCGEWDSTTEDVTLESGVPEGGGSVARIGFPNPDGERSIVPRNEDICIGDSCTHETGQGPTSFDSNEYVNKTGDKMSGSLKVDTVEMPSGETLCIGQGCSFSSGSAEGLLGSGSGSMDGSIETPALTTDDSQCIGSSC